jgi:hemerythrin
MCEVESILGNATSYLLYSIEYKKTKEHFIERAKNVMNKIFENYDVPAIKKNLKNIMPRYIVSHFNIYFFTNCICI